MIITVKLTNLSIYSHGHLCVCIVRTLKIQSFSKFKYTVQFIDVVTKLYIRSPKLIHPAQVKFYPLTSIFQFLQLSVPNHHHPYSVSEFCCFRFYM